MLSGSVVSAPHAWASCNMSPADDQYISLLAQNKMVHTADFNDCNEAAEGHWFANEVTSAADPYGRAKDLVKMVNHTTGMTSQQSEWEVESAIYVYAPQMIPKIKDEPGSKRLLRLRDALGRWAPRSTRRPPRIPLATHAERFARTVDLRFRGNPAGR